MTKHIASFAVVLAMAVACALFPSSADAQGFALNRYRPAPSSTEGFGILSPAPPPHLTLDFRLALDYAYGSLAVSTTDADGREHDGYLVEHTFTTHLAASLGLADWFGVWVGLPVSWVQSGDDVSGALPGTTPIEGPAAGDMAIGVRAKLMGERERPTEGADFSLGLAAALLLPTGVPESLTGDGGVGLRAIATASVQTAMFTPIVNLGFAYRPDNDYMGVARPGSELLFGIGAHLHLDPVRIEGELRGATTVTSDQAFSGDAVPIELLLGAHFDLGSGLAIGLAANVGVTQGVGVPQPRILATLGYALPLGGDGAADDDDADEDGLGSGDSDGDGIQNDHDECPSRAEDADGHADEDGCPEDDADGDGNPDDDDFCPEQPETINDYLDDDGCPDGASIDGSSIETTEPVVFANRRVRLTSEVEASLALVAEFLQDNPDIALVQVEGHAADDEGNTNRKLGLSEQRAEAVVEFLVAQGVNAGRLTFVGMGSDVPATPGAHEENRRVTFRVLERR